MNKAFPLLQMSLMLSQLKNISIGVKNPCMSTKMLPFTRLDQRLFRKHILHSLVLDVDGMLHSLVLDVAGMCRDIYPDG